MGPNADLDNGPCLDADLDEGVLTIALNRPQQRNAINVPMALAMERLLTAVSADDAVRVLVLRGNGPAFCVGLEATEFFDTASTDERSLRAARASVNNWRTRLLRLLPQPVIAMVHGQCHAGAIAMLESCDIAIAADDADFVLTGETAADLLLAPEAKSISRVMEPRAASRFALTGQSFDGKEAQRNGLVTQSVPAPELQAQTYQLARELAGKDALALRFTKETLQHVADMSWDGVLSFTSAKFAELKSLQAGRPSSRATAVESFLAGKTKPGAGV